MGNVIVTIKCERPTAVSAPELRMYIRDALKAWGGSFSPDDPLFNGIACKAIKVEKAKPC